MTLEYCMARGFESKDVEYQQSEAERRPSQRQAMSGEERERAATRATIALALASARADLAAARSPGHVRMLESAVRALEAQLASLSHGDK